ncbi:hypothetical protein, partial [Listeria innocua]
FVQGIGKIPLEIDKHAIEAGVAEVKIYHYGYMSEIVEKQ